MNSQKDILFVRDEERNFDWPSKIRVGLVQSSGCMYVCACMKRL